MRLLTTFTAVFSSVATAHKTYSPTTKYRECTAADRGDNFSFAYAKNHNVESSHDDSSSFVQTRLVDAKRSNDKELTFSHGQCGLYLAPSSLPHARLGLYSGIAIPFGESVNEYVGGTFPGYDDDEHPPLWTDIFIPVADHYKAHPFRGQQRLPSWLQYVWPETPGAFTDLEDHHHNPKPYVPPALWGFDEGLNAADGLKFYASPHVAVSCFVPGLATLANSHGSLSNIDQMKHSWSAEQYSEQTGHPWNAEAGAFTPHHNIEFIVTEEDGILEGQELLLDYGDEWNGRNYMKTKWLASAKTGTLDRKGFVEGVEKKWSSLDNIEYEKCPRSLPTEKAKRDLVVNGKGESHGGEGDSPGAYSQYRKNNFHPNVRTLKRKAIEEKEPDHMTPKSLLWLNQNGVCMSSGRLKIGPSSVSQGRGVYSTTKISKDEVLLTTPAIAMRAEDFVIYKINPKAASVRDEIEKTIVGKELLFNYAFTHPDSPLYLVPSGPLANHFNHGGEDANVQVRWPKQGSNAARLFEWAYKQQHGSNIHEEDFIGVNLTDPNPWLRDHPIDVMERSGKLAFEYVALREIKRGEELLIDYGALWDSSWKEYVERHPYARTGYFRHAIGVPDGFFPENWLHVSDRYEIAEIKDLKNKPLEPGAVVPLTWAHNGKPVGSKWAYVVGMDKGFSDRFLQYSAQNGVVDLFGKLFTKQELFHDEFKVSELGNRTSELTGPMEFFSHRPYSNAWNDLHYVAAWNEVARRNLFKWLGDSGFDLALKGLGERFGYDNLTCFHSSYMGMTHCDKSKMHSDIYATEDKSWNLLFPLITVEGTDPELDIVSEDMNTVVGVHYLKDVVYALGDWGFHQTRRLKYDDAKGTDAMANGLRVVFGAYCAQIDESNVAMIRHIYDGDDPAPFADQFLMEKPMDIHWDSASTSSLAKPGGKVID